MRARLNASGVVGLFLQNQHYPDGKVIMPGVIDSTTNYIEPPDLVAERLICFGQRVGREQVIAGVDCGLSTSAVSTKIDPDIAWAKLRSLVEGARLAFKRLWSSRR